jgi:hypothetical protein
MDRPPFLLGRKAISQLAAGGTDIDVAVRVVSEALLAIEALSGVGAGQGLDPS